MKRCLSCDCSYESHDWGCPGCGLLPTKIDGYPSFAPEEATTDGGFKSEAFAVLANLETENFWFQARNRLIMWSLNRYFPNMQRFLEIGCGTGFVLEEVSRSFPHALISGSEIQSAGLSFATARVPSAEFLQMDAKRMPYRAEFDVIGAFDVLEHIKEDEDVIKEIRNALVDGGGAIFTVPQHPWMWSSADEYACHVRRYRVGELREKLMRMGFRVKMETSFVSLLLPAMVASRWMKKDVPIHDINAELKLSKLINQSFLGVMAVERSLIKVGLRFPFGGSGLMIVEKNK